MTSDLRAARNLVRIVSPADTPPSVYLFGLSAYSNQWFVKPTIAIDPGLKDLTPVMSSSSKIAAEAIIVDWRRFTNLGFFLLENHG